MTTTVPHYSVSSGQNPGALPSLDAAGLARVRELAAQGRSVWGYLVRPCSAPLRRRLPRVVGQAEWRSGRCRYEWLKQMLDSDTRRPVASLMSMSVVWCSLSDVRSHTTVVVTVPEALTQASCAPWKTAAGSPDSAATDWVLIGPIVHVHPTSPVGSVAPGRQSKTRNPARRSALVARDASSMDTRNRIGRAPSPLTGVAAVTTTTAKGPGTAKSTGQRWSLRGLMT